MTIAKWKTIWPQFYVRLKDGDYCRGEGEGNIDLEKLWYLGKLSITLNVKRKLTNAIVYQVSLRVIPGGLDWRVEKERNRKENIREQGNKQANVNSVNFIWFEVISNLLLKRQGSYILKPQFKVSNIRSLTQHKKELAFLGHRAWHSPDGGVQIELLFATATPVTTVFSWTHLSTSLSLQQDMSYSTLILIDLMSS